MQDVKKKFGEIVEQALAHGAQIITCRGKKLVVVMPFEEYEKLALRGGSLTQFLLASPLAGSELVIDRDKSLL